MQGERVPVIHTVGFFAEEQRGGPGERFLRQLSALTGGTFQVSPLSYCPALTCPAIPCPALPSLVLPCPAFSCPALPWPALSCPDLPCPAIPCPALPSLVLPCPALASLVLPCPAPSLPCCAHLYCSAVLVWAMPGCRCHCTLYLSLTMHLLLLHPTCLPHSPCPSSAATQSSWLPDTLAGHDDAVPAELCCLVAPLQYVAVLVFAGIQARGMEGVEWG